MNTHTRNCRHYLACTYVDTQKESGTLQSRTVQRFVQISVLDEEATVWNKYKTDEFVMNRLPLQLLNYLQSIQRGVTSR